MGCEAANMAARFPGGPQGGGVPWGGRVLIAARDLTIIVEVSLSRPLAPLVSFGAARAPFSSIVCAYSTCNTHGSVVGYGWGGGTEGEGRRGAWARARARGQALSGGKSHGDMRGKSHGVSLMGTLV